MRRLDRTLVVKMSRAEWETYQQMAQHEGRTLSNWVRRVLASVAETGLEDPRLGLEDMMEEAVGVRAPSGRAGRCARHNRKACGACRT